MERPESRPILPRFGQDAAETGHRARVIMRGVYAAVLLVGGVFLYVAFSSTPVHPRTAVQAVIFIGLGTGGLLMDWSRGGAESSPSVQ